MKNIETILTEELRPVAAPPELRDRVENPQVERREPRFQFRPLVIAAAVAMLVVASAWGLRARNEIRSSDPAEVRAWVQSRAGLDVPVSPHTPAKLVQTRLVSGGAEINYRVDDFPVKLLIAKGGPEPADGHPFYGPESTRATWSLNGQIFTLECPSPKALQASCRLCHA